MEKFHKFNVSVGKARGFAEESKDAATNMNPFVQLHVEGDIQETSVLPGQFHPLWNDEYTFALKNPRKAVCNVSLLSRQKDGRDKFLGQVNFNIASLGDKAKEWTFYPLGAKESEENIKGQVELKCDYLTIKGETRLLEEEKKGLADAEDFAGAERIRKKITKLKESDPKEHKTTFRVKLTSGKGFISDSTSAEFYVVLAFGKQKQKSQPKKKTLSPEWEETFVFDVDTAKGLPPKLRVDVHDKKTCIGSAVINLSSMTDDRTYQAWYSLRELGETEDPYLGEIELKMSFYEEIVLPEIAYAALLEILLDSGYPVISALTMAKGINVRDIVRPLLRLCESRGHIMNVLKTAIWRELHAKDVKEATVFRTDTLTTKMMDAYWDLIGFEYRKAVITPLLEDIQSTNKEYELDPKRISENMIRENNVHHVLMAAELVLNTITSTAHLVPPPFRELFLHVRSEVGRIFPQNPDTQYIAVTGFLFLRFLCPAISSPQKYGLAKEAPDPRVARGLILVTKCLQNLANLVEFGEKEQYMMDMNSFVDHNKQALKTFVDSVAIMPAQKWQSPVPPQTMSERVSDLARIHRGLNKNLEPLQKFLCSDEVNARGLFDRIKFVCGQLDNAYLLATDHA